MTRVYSRAASPDRDIVRSSPHVSRDAAQDRVNDGARVEIKSDRWINPTNLDAPPANPGMVQRWVGESPIPEVNRGWLKKMREGWRARDPATIPPALREVFPSGKLVSGAEVVRVAGLVLCEMPVQVARQRALALNDVNTRQQKAIPESIEQLRSSVKGASDVLGEVQVTNEETGLRGRQATTMAN